MTQSEVGTASEAKSLLQTLELPEPSSGQPLRFDDEGVGFYSHNDMDEAVASFKNRMILVNDPKLTAQQQSDVVLSNLLAQLNSDKLYKQETQMPEW
ncbi:hypothetical protein ACIBF1_06925 [Spirillospora sp. NPDC050679]